MRANWKYVFAVALLAVLAVVFGLAGTVAPVSKMGSPQQSSPSSSDPVTHFMNPPTFDSGWVNITDKCGQFFNIPHDITAREVFVDIIGKQSLKEKGGEHQRHLGVTALIPGWSRTYGGEPGNERANSVVQTSDGGFAVVGYTSSYAVGWFDFWLVKTDAYGNMLWNRAYEGGGIDIAYSVIQTDDGGYIIGGALSQDGVLGTQDAWLVKTDAFGNMLWNRTYGGAACDEAYSLVQTIDDGYALAGRTMSYGAGGVDFWLVKTDSNGNTQWNRTYGGVGYDEAYSLVQTIDGGYVLAGYTDSYGAGSGDVWLVKTESNGNVQWNRTYGGARLDWAESVVQTGDGGYAIAGATHYSGYDSNMWLIKTDSAGNLLWDRIYGETEPDIAFSLVQSSEGGYAIAGETKSYGAGNRDFWLVKTDAFGNILWNATYGGIYEETAYSVTQTSNNGYVLAGQMGLQFLGLVRTDVELGLTYTHLTSSTITLYRGKTDPYWNFVRVRIWTIEEPTWQFGDINQDGVVDVQDLYILSQNYGKTFSILSLTGIIVIAGIHTYKKRKQQE